MATPSKQYKAIGEDLWKGRTEKVVSGTSTRYLSLTQRLGETLTDPQIRMQNCLR